MKIIFKISSKLFKDIQMDLARPHDVAAERVGFVGCPVSDIKNGLMILAENYYQVADDDYLDDQSVGAMMGPDAIRKALQTAYNHRLSMFHIHSHDHYGTPWFSRLDLRENTKFVPDFWNVQPNFPHGALVFSLDRAAGLCWIPRKKRPFRIDEIVIVGAPMKFVRHGGL